MINFSNKVVLITGASGAIGASIAKSFYDLGATIAISGTRTQALEHFADHLNKDRVHIFTCDLSDKQQVEQLIPSVENALGRLDILVNNAGLTRDALIIRMKDEDWETVLNVNLFASFQLCRAASKLMMKQRYGRIINITSVVGVTGNPGQSNYCASKAGLIGLSKSLAQELATRGITVNCVAPGFIESSMTSHLPEKVKMSILSNIPQGTMGTPEDISFAVMYLAHEKAGYITGQTLHINGGMTMI